jgi:hypothetical protein
MILARIAAYLLLFAIWRRMGWPAWSFLVVALAVFLGGRALGDEWPFGRRRGVGWQSEPPAPY